jgi:hypothetical protein
MAPAQPSNLGEKINLIALIFGTTLSIIAIIIAIATCRRTKAKALTNQGTLKAIVKLKHMIHLFSGTNAAHLAGMNDWSSMPVNVDLKKLPPTNRMARSFSKAQILLKELSNFLAGYLQQGDQELTVSFALHPRRRPRRKNTRST